MAHRWFLGYNLLEKIPHFATGEVCVLPPRDCREACGANAKGQRVLTTHIWQECLDLAEQLRKTNLGIKIYALCKETIERVFADAKGKHGMRYARHRGLARVFFLGEA